MADINDILGNERVKEHFIAAVHHKKISHAYIIEGDKGSGKKMLASAFSKILQCETRQKTEEERACNQCESCIQMENKDHPDVIWVSHEKAGVISVGEIREQVVNTVDIMPYKGPYKIYIIDEAEKMNVAAQNAILKTIEEPPEYAIIFLLTTNRGAFLDTILSRCILLETKPVSGKMIERYLGERYKIPEEEAELDLLERYVKKGNTLSSLQAVCDAQTLLEMRQACEQVVVHRSILEYARNIAKRTREEKKLALGVSTRGVIALISMARAYAAVCGEEFVTPDRIKELAPLVYAHRIISEDPFLTQRTTKDVMKDLIKAVEVPTEDVL